MLRLWHWPSLPAALLIEAAALVWLLGWPWRRAALAALAVNALSLLAGFVLYPPVAMLLAEPARLIAAASGPAATGVLYGLVALGLALVDTVVEYPALRWMFRLKPSGRALTVVFGANLASAAALMGMVAYGDLPARMSDREIAALDRHYAAELALMQDILTTLQTANTPPWDDPDWRAERSRAAERLRFQWLELRLSPGTRLTLVPMTDPVNTFDGRHEEPGRLILRGSRPGGALYRIQLGVVDENGLGAHVIADLAAPPPP